jgi:hypothetical protein
MVKSRGTSRQTTASRMNGRRAIRKLLFFIKFFSEQNLSAFQDATMGNSKYKKSDSRYSAGIAKKTKPCQSFLTKNAKKSKNILSLLKNHYRREGIQRKTAFFQTFSHYYFFPYLEIMQGWDARTNPRVREEGKQTTKKKMGENLASPY